MSAQKKQEVLRAVEGSGLPVRDALARLDLAPSTAKDPISFGRLTPPPFGQELGLVLPDLDPG